MIHYWGDPASHRKNIVLSVYWFSAVAVVSYRLSPVPRDHSNRILYRPTGETLGLTLREYCPQADTFPGWTCWELNPGLETSQTPSSLAYPLAGKVHRTVPVSASGIPE